MHRTANQKTVIPSSAAEFMDNRLSSEDMPVVSPAESSSAANHTPRKRAKRMNMSATPSASKKPVSDGKYVKKIKWNKNEHYAFLKHVAYVIRKGHRRGKTLDASGWKQVIDLFQHEEGMVVDEQMLRNHYDKARRFFQGWKELKSYTGGAYSDQKSTYECPDYFWTRFLERHPACGRFKEWGYDADAEYNLNSIFQGTCATGEYRWHPGGQPQPVVPPHGLVDEDDYDDMMSAPLEDLVRDVNAPLPQEFTTTVDFDIGSPPRTQEPPHTQDSQRSRSVGMGSRPQPHRKRKSRLGSVDPSVQSTSHILAQTLLEWNVLYKESLRVQQETNEKQLLDPVQQQLNDCIEFLRTLPDYDFTVPMYFEAPDYFMDETVRKTWLSMRCDPGLAAYWLKNHWEKQNK